VKRTFTNFPTTHHNLGSSRAMLNHLGGFTFKSNKCHKYSFIKFKCSSAHKEDSLNPQLRFSHKSQDPHKEGLERAHKGLGWVYFVGGTSCLQRREGESFYTCLPKTSRWKLASKNQNIRFLKLNIRYLKTSRWSSSAQTRPSGLGNWTIQFFLIQWDMEYVWSLCFTHLT
jgi:hypothetical protein